MAVSQEVSNVPAKTNFVLSNTLSKKRVKISHTYYGNSKIGVVEFFFERKDVFFSPKQPWEQQHMLPMTYKPPGQNYPDTLHNSAFNKYVMS